MEANNRPFSPRITQLTKSNSQSSARSAQSHKSVKALGAFPLGTLHVHDADQGLAKEGCEHDSDDGGPPPLDPPTADAPAPEGAVKRLSQGSSRSLPGQVLRHDLGGGDVVLILDLPEVFTIGYDSVSFTAKHFGGVRDIPPGPHFFWIAHPNGLSARCGFWILSSGVDTIHIVQWDKFNEALTQPSRAEARIQAENLDTFHSKLVPYPDPSSINKDRTSSSQLTSDKHLSMWKQLTGSISEELLTRVTGHRFDWMVHTGDRVHGSVLDTAELRLNKTMQIPMLQTQELNFTFDQRSKSYSTAQTGAERTQLATDSTEYIRSSMAHIGERVAADEIVGEFQFAFVVGVHLGNDACIQQWWHMLLKIFLRAYTLPVSHPGMASSFFRSLNAQLSYSCSWLDGSILDHADAPTRDLRLSLTVYKRRLDELLLEKNSSASSEELDVATAFSGVEAMVTDKLDWDLRGDYLRRGNVMMEDGEQVELEVTDLEADDERGEWAPAVVDLDEAGRERDRVSWCD